MTTRDVVVVALVALSIVLSTSDNLVGGVLILILAIAQQIGGIRERRKNGNGNGN